MNPTVEDVALERLLSKLSGDRYNYGAITHTFLMAITIIVVFYMIQHAPKKLNDFTMPMYRTPRYKIPDYFSSNTMRFLI